LVRLNLSKNLAKEKQCRGLCFAKASEQSRTLQVGFDARSESLFGAFDVGRGVGICCDVAELDTALRWLYTVQVAQAFVRKAEIVATGTLTSVFFIHALVESESSQWVI
jgi:hypothetical protein